MNNDGRFKATAINEHLWSIEEDYVRCYLIKGAEKALLLDTCTGGEELKELVCSLTALPVTTVFTHCDSDHTGGGGYFGIPSLHPSEYSYYRERSGQALKLKALWDEDRIDLGGRLLTVLHLPGHTPGSIALLDKESREIFTGDMISTAPVFMFGPGRSLEAYIESMKKLSKQSDSFDQIYACHGNAVLTPERIPEMITAAEKVLSGEIKGEAPDRDLPCLLYTDGSVKFYYK